VRTGDTAGGLRRVGTALAIVTACLLLAPALHGSAASAGPALTAAFSPGTLDIASGGTRKAELLVTNTGTTPITGLRCAFTSDDGIKATPALPPPTGASVSGLTCINPPSDIGNAAATASPAIDLAAGASTGLAVAVTRSVGAPAASSVEAVLTYVTGAAGADPPETVIASLAVGTPAAPATPPARLLVTPTLGRAQLVEYQTTDLIFTIANQSDRGQLLTSAMLTYPSTLKVTAILGDGTETAGSDGRLRFVIPRGALGPGDTDVVHATVSAPDAVQPGDALVGLQVSAIDAVDRTHSTVVSTQKLTFSVLGESAVLQALGVPSLLLVPGIIMAVILWALWTQVSPGEHFSLQPDGTGVAGSVVLWVFALVPSLALPFAYPVITGWFGHRRDYRTAYGLDDILFLWFIAAAAAALVWMFALVVRWGLRKFWIPQVGDSPRALITKAALRPWDRSLVRQSAMYNGEQRVIILRQTAVGPLVTPAVAYTYKGLSEAEETKLAEHSSRHPVRLALFVRNRKDKVRFSYASEAPLAEPTVVKANTLSERAEDALVREQP